VAATRLVLAPFPVVALVPSMRSVGVVCLDARLRPLRSRLRGLRKRRTRAAKVAAMRAELERCVRLHGAPVLVLEIASCRRRGVGPMLTALVAHGEDLGMRVVRLATGDAYERISGVPTALGTAEALAQRYDPVRVRVMDASGRLLRSFGRWREIRPLIAAFALAHAFAVRTIVGAASGGLAPVHLVHPHDPKSPRPP